MKSKKAPAKKKIAPPPVVQQQQMNAPQIQVQANQMPMQYPGKPVVQVPGPYNMTMAPPQVPQQVGYYGGFGTGQPQVNHP